MLDVKALREDFPALSSMTFLNNGAVGITPAPAVDAMCKALRLSEESGQRAYAHFAEERTAARSAMAKFVGADPDEIAFATNATEAVNWIVAALAFRPGEEVLISDYEHPALVYPVSWQQGLGRIRATYFEVSADPDQTLAAVEAAITRRTRMIAVSHVERHNGVRLPVEAICRLAAERGILTLVDGAQTLGMIPVDVRAVGADFYIGNLHKWLCGPNGTGLFYGRADRLRLLTQAHVGPTPGSDWDLVGGLNLPLTASRFEYGTATAARYTGALASLSYLGQIGFDRIEQQLIWLKAQTESLIEDHGWEVVSPSQWERSSALVSFAVPGGNGGRICQELAEQKIYLSGTQDGGIRISPHIYNTEDEIARSLDAIAAALG